MDGSNVNHNALGEFWTLSVCVDSLAVNVMHMAV